MKHPTDYQLWKEGHYLTLRAYTEEEVFNFGYIAGVSSQVTPVKEDISGAEIVHTMNYPKEEEAQIGEPKIPKNNKKK